MIEVVNRWLATRTALWVVLALCVGTVATIWHLAREHVTREQAILFDAEIGRNLTGLNNRLGNYEQVLMSGSAFFAADEYVSRGEWGQFVTPQRVQERFPGIQGIGYAAWVAKADRQSHVEEVRKIDHAAYDIRPPGERDHYAPIVYNEPHVGQNSRDVGFDMYSEATRRQAIERSRRSGTTALSGKVVLAGDNPDERPLGFVMYVPIRKMGASDVAGFVFAPFRMGDFMSGFLKEHDPKLGFRIYDGNRIDREALMFDAIDAIAGFEPSKTLVRTVQFVFAGRTWTIEFVAPADFDPTRNVNVPWVMLVIGVVISTLIVAMMRALYSARQSESRFRDYANLASDWLWEQDEELRFTYHSGLNKPAVVIFGRMFLGRTRREFFERHGDAKEKAVWDSLDDAAARHQPFKDVTYSLFNEDGRRLYYQISGAPVFDPQGTFLGYRGIGKDVTAEMERIEETRQAKITAELASASKTRFLAMMSHELRTPLNAIIGFADMLANPAGRTAEAAREFAHDIATSSRHLLDMINHILDMAKIEAGRLELVDEPIDLRRAVKASLPLVTSKAEQGGVALEIRLPGDLPSLRADNRAVRQILVNLLSNAVKFTPRGGSVTIRAERRADGAMAVVIEDTGIGIAPSALSRIFEPFQQADASIARRFGGTGLGLPISKALMDAFGGGLEIDSSLGKGTRASAVFPASRVIA